MAIHRRRKLVAVATTTLMVFSLFAAVAGPAAAFNKGVLSGDSSGDSSGDEFNPGIAEAIELAISIFTSNKDFDPVEINCVTVTDGDFAGDSSDGDDFSGDISINCSGEDGEGLARDFSANCEIDTSGGDGGGDFSRSFSHDFTGDWGGPGDAIHDFLDDFLKTFKDLCLVEEDVLPQLSVVKTAGVASVLEPGDDVTFTVEITNPSTVEILNIMSIVDDLFGTLAGDGDCMVGTTLAAGAACSFGFTMFVGGPGDVHTNTVTVIGEDNEGNTVQDSDDASVDIGEEVLGTTITAPPSTLPLTGIESGQMVGIAIMLLGSGILLTMIGLGRREET